MPQLDRILSRLAGGAASEVVLEADAPIRCVTPSGLQAVTQQLLSRQQVLALVAEIASPADRASVNTGVNVRVQCALNGNSYAFTQDDASPALRIVARRAAVAPSVAARAASSPAGASAPPAGEVGAGEEGGECRVWRRRATDQLLGPFATPAEAKEAMERLLRLQVTRKAADLHLRIGEPPILRTGGDLVRVEGDVS